MALSQRRRAFLWQLRPWLGLAIAAAAVILGLRAVAAGTAGAGLPGYVAGMVQLAAGYVAGRRAWVHRFDGAFAGAVTVVFVLGVMTFLALEPPPTVYERMVAR